MLKYEHLRFHRCCSPPAYSVLTIEVKKFIGIIQGEICQHCYDGERDVVLLEQPHTLEDGRMCARSSPRYSLPVMNEGRPVQAHAYPHVMLFDERDPAVIDQCRIGLERVNVFSAISLANALNLREGFL